MRTHRCWILLTLLMFSWAGVEAAPNAAPQGLSKTLYKDKVNGFKFRPPGKYNVVPGRKSMRDRGLLCWMDSDVRESGGYLWVVRLDGTIELVPKKKAKKKRKKDKDEEEELEEEDEEEKEDGEEEGEDSKEEAKEESDEKERRSRVLSRRPTLEQFLKYFAPKTTQGRRPNVDKQVKINGVMARERHWAIGFTVLDVYSFPGPDADFHLLYFVDSRFTKEKAGRSWLKMHAKSARSFERTKRASAVDTSAMDYATLLKYHKVLDAQFKDWRILPTPKKKFIIKTSSRRGAFIKNVISRLDRSRKLFERDFPPQDFGQELNAVSIVRICETEEEFHKYGGTGKGVGGWFNPSSEELVLFSGTKDKEGDALTLGVMSHEAFHQYCHFLFRRSEAHRWFDEGHGDYYAAAAWFQGKSYVKAEAESWRINRLPLAKEMAGEGSMIPLKKHLNYSHSQWQKGSLRSYSQSWSIVYTLRKGVLGKVPKQYWKKEYAQILPNYMNSLLKGYADEYAKIVAKREKKAKDNNRELTEEERNPSRKDIKTSARKRVWKKAMDDSWGKIDLDEFEVRWLDYVAHALK